MRLLLIEDSLPLQKSLARGLREAGYVLDVSGTGPEGLWYASENDYDAIVLDLMLPGLDGLSLLRTLRRKKTATPVLILTARDALADKLAGLDAGADDYLVKPFAFAELLARVRALVRRGYGRAHGEVRVGDLRVDTTARRVWRGRDEIPLTAREYDLLEYLAVRAGEIVSRTDIREHLYAFEDDGDSNVVDVYIGYLRRKLDRRGAPPAIRTVRGRGYVLEAAP
jgi:DNA-binding response OmpR family regulator